MALSVPVGAPVPRSGGRRVVPSRRFLRVVRSRYVHHPAGEEPVVRSSRSRLADARRIPVEPWRLSASLRSPALRLRSGHAKQGVSKGAVSLGSGCTLVSLRATPGTSDRALSPLSVRRAPRAARRPATKHLFRWGCNDGILRQSASLVNGARCAAERSYGRWVARDNH